MPPSKKKSGTAPSSTGYSDAAKTAVQETTLRIKEIHGAIAGKSFDILQKIPLISGPATIVQRAHDTITAGVYAAIHYGTGGLLGAVSMLEKHSTGFAPGEPPGCLASGLRSALNGAFGDHLAASNNLLAISMAIHVNGAPIKLDAEALRSAFPKAGKRLCVFIHGLSCDEHCWEVEKTSDRNAATAEIDFGRQLDAEFHYAPLYLRYNSGLPIVQNGQQLADFLAALLAIWPQPDGELLIIGHSMGGLVALAACENAAAAGMQWPQSTSMLICLGSPNLGSPLERLGHLATSALLLTKTTAPLGKMAATRSQGIKDLRHGPGAPRKSPTQQHMAFRFLGASLADDIDHPFGEFLGDGLVTLDSATTHEIVGDVQSARLGNIGHMGLVTDARVYRQIREWVAVLEKSANGKKR
jgi:pimeloyl-ACP methyl ester carboxylesterase